MSHDPIPEHLKLYHNPDYFTGGGTISGYDDYARCKGVLEHWSHMLGYHFNPTSVVDAGAAYGFVVDWFRERGVPAWGVEPSPVALSHVPERIANYVFEGALPGPWPELPKADLVTCTEVLEHVPEALVPEALQVLADQSSQWLVCLVMLEGPGADGDEGHITLKSRAWWEAQFDALPGFDRAPELEEALNTDPYSVRMYWATRFFVRRRHG